MPASRAIRDEEPDVIDDIAFLDDSTRPSAPAIPDATPQHRAHGRRLSLFHRFHLQQMAAIRQALAALERGAGDAAALAEAVSNMEMIENYRRVGTPTAAMNASSSPCTTPSRIRKFFPRLRNQSAGLRAVIDRLSQEHEIVHTLLERLEQAAMALSDTPSPEALADLRTIFDALHKVVASHFGYEEEELAEALGYLWRPALTMLILR